MNIPSSIQSMLKYGILSLSLLVLVGTILARYSAGIYIAIGIAVLLGLGGLYLFVRRIAPKEISISTLIIAWVVIMVICLMIAVIMLWLPQHSALLPCMPGSTKHALELTGYSAEVEPVNLAEGSFRVSEHITYQEREAECNGFNGWDYTDDVQGTVERDLPSRIVQSTKSGLFLHEVIIPNQLNDYDCCPSEASAVIKSLPFNSFYDAQYANDLNVDEYLGTETISWKTSDLDMDLRFAYLPKPFNNWRILLDPFILLSKNEDWILAFIGLLISFIFLSVIKPIILDTVKDKFKSLFKKDGPNVPPKPPKRRANRNQ